MRIDEISNYTDHEQPEELEATLRRLIVFVKKNCQPYLNELNCFENPSHALFRGTNNVKLFNGPVVVKPRLNRKPMNTQIHAHEILTKAFTELGFVANRNNSFFAGSKSEAKSYGHLTAIFPIGNFNYTYSPLIEDLYMGIDHVLLKGVTKVKNFTDIPAFNPENLETDHRSSRVILRFFSFCYSSNLLKPKVMEMLNDVDTYQGTVTANIQTFIRSLIDKAGERITKDNYVKPQNFGTFGYLIDLMIEGTSLEDRLNRIRNSHSADSIFGELRSDIVTATGGGVGYDKFFAPYIEYDIEKLKYRLKNELKYTDKNLLDAVDKGVEVMVHCKKMLLVPIKVFDKMLLTERFNRP